MDPNHYNPKGPDQIRFRDPNGRPLDWHPKNPNKSPKTWGGKDHWHDPNNFGNKHLPPGTEVPDPEKPPLRVPKIWPPMRGPQIFFICPECVQHFIDEFTGRNSCNKDS